MEEDTAPEEPEAKKAAEPVSDGSAVVDEADISSESTPVEKSGSTEDTQPKTGA